MTFRWIATGAVVAALSVTQADRATAEVGDFVAGAIVGGIIGGAIAKDKAKRKSTARSTRSTATSPAASAQREANREVQTALNYWGFPVGAPDGAIGPKSRAGIAEYQIAMGWPGTGELTDFERDVLVSSYQRAQAGGATTAALIAQNPMGARGVLTAWKNERLAAAPAPAPAPGAPLNPFAPAPAGAAPDPLAPAGQAAPATAAIMAATPPAAEPAPLPTFAAAAPAAPAAPPAATPATPALPSFLAAAPEAVVSLASHCSKVSLLTNSNGGFVTPVSMTDPNFALSEQFCLARTYGIAEGEKLAARVTGFSASQIAEQCTGFAPLLKPYVDAVSVKPRDELLAEVTGFVAGSGMGAAQLAGTAKICLGVGYTTDNTDVALGSAILLAAMGEKSYGELVGHHLSQGIGAARRPDLALQWYEGALGRPGDAVVSVFAPGMADRADLIRMAAYAVAGETQPGDMVPAPAVEAAQPDTPGKGGGILPFRLPYIGSK